MRASRERVVRTATRRRGVSVVMAAALFAALFAPLSRADASSDGDVDASFGEGGVTSARNGEATSVAIAADGSIFLGGYDLTATMPTFVQPVPAVGKVDPTGHWATSFGAGGIAHPFGPDVGRRVLSVVVDGDGVVGTTDAAELFRLLADGTLDASFGVGGVTRTDRAGRVVRDVDGRYLVGDPIYVSRYTTGGSRDSSYGSGGSVRHSTSAYVEIPSLAVGQAGDVFVAGRYGVEHIDGAGVVDPAFGAGAPAPPPFGVGAHGVAVDLSGRPIVVATLESADSSRSWFVVARYTLGGGLDQAFGQAGFVTTTIETHADTSGVVVDAEGRIVVSGTSTLDTSTDGYETAHVAVARYLSDGRADTTFARCGVAVASSASVASLGTFSGDAVLVDRASRPVVAGGSAPTRFGPASRFGAVRFTERRAGPGPAVRLDASGSSGPTPLRTRLEVSACDGTAPISAFRATATDGALDESGPGRPPPVLEHVGSHIGFYGATVTVTDENDLASSATTPIYPWRSGQRDWYFAEGTVRPGFVEYVVLAAESPATARLSFALSRDDGSVVAAPDLTMTVDTSVRVTINVNSTLEKAGVRGPVDVAIHVSADEPVAAERLMYFVSDPALGATVAGATDILGATDPATTTFFAEGTFRAGFEEFLTLLNPGSVDTTATVVLQLSAGSVDPVIVPLPRRSRRTIDVTRYLAAHGVDAPVDMSAEVTSAEPIVTERPIYFASVQGGSLIVGGTTATGTSDPSTQRLFAEGTVRPGFVEYLTLENPGTSNAHVRITYQATAPSGRVDVAPTDIVVGPARRSTVDVPDALAGTGAFDVAATVTSDVPVVAERVLYFSADPGLGTTTSGATSSPGTAAAGTEFLFAEGTLRPGWIEYLTIQNPNDGTIGFVVDFMGVDTPQVNGRNTCDPAPLQPRSRTTIDITALLRCRNLREPADVAFRLRASDNIVAERAVYFDSDPGLGHEVASGTDVVGSQR